MPGANNNTDECGRFRTGKDFMELKNEKFTAREKTSKSLSLELVPCEATLNAIENAKLIDADKRLYDLADGLKRFYDVAIKEISAKAINGVAFDFDALYDAYLLYKSGADMDTYRKASRELLDAISESVAGALPKQIRKTADLSSAAFIYDCLPDIVKGSSLLDDEAKAEFREIIATESGLTPLLSRFCTTRITALETWIPERVVENIQIYFDNIRLIIPFLETPEGEAFAEEFEEIRDFVEPGYYRFCMTAEGISGYNHVINGENDENGIVRKGYNMVVNEKNTKTKQDKAGGAYFRKLHTLNQQILEPKEKQFKIESLENDDDVRALLEETSELVSQKAVYECTSVLKKGGAEKLLVKGNDVHAFSHCTTGDHKTISAQLYDQERLIIEEAIKEAKAAKEKKKIKELERSLDIIDQTINNRNYTIRNLEILSGMDDLFSGFIEAVKLAESKIAEKWAKIVSGHLLQQARIYKKDSAVIAIKEYYDAINEYSNLVKLVSKCSTDESADPELYNRIDEISEVFRKANKAYNLIRNYLTRTPEDMSSKCQLVFGATGNFSGKWWSGEKAGVGVNLLYKDTTDEPRYYFAMTPGTAPARSFDLPLAEQDEEAVCMLSYKKSPTGASMFVPRVLFSKAVKAEFEGGAEEVVVDNKFDAPLHVSRELYEDYIKGRFKADALRKGIVTPEEYKAANARYVEAVIHMCRHYQEWARFGLSDFEAKDYETLEELYAVLDVSLFTMEWERVSKAGLDKLIEDGYLLSFQLKARDLWRYDKAIDKHTPYVRTFLTIFSDENMAFPNIKLNAAPSVTYREPVLDMRVTHAKGSMLLDRNDKEGNHIPNDLYVEIYNYLNQNMGYEDMSEEAREWLPKAKYHVAKRDIYKDKRYGETKYYLAISYTKNSRVNVPRFNPINDDVSAALSEAPFRTLAVVRGTVDLCAYVLFDKDRKTVLDSGNFNVIGGIDYKNRLQELSAERLRAKQSEWVYDKRISDCKDAYIQAVASEIVNKAVTCDSVIVIEKISDAVKDRLSALDTTLYKGLEGRIQSALADYTKVAPEGPGSMIMPLQLSSNAIKSEASQNGILFKVGVAYTKICPKTGFANLFDLYNINSIKAKRAFLERFKSIDVKDNRIEYVFDYCDFDNVKYKLPSREWTVYAFGPATFWNAEKRRFDYIENIAADALTEMYHQNLVGEISKEIPDMASKYIEQLYDLFKTAVLRNEVKACKENPRTYYCSPVVLNQDTMVTPSYNAAVNLAKKFWWHRDCGSVLKKEAYTTGWLEYIQNK